MLIKTTSFKIFICLLVFFSTFAANAQQWNTVGSGIGDPNSSNGDVKRAYSEVYGNKLYVGQQVGFGPNAYTKVSVWNGAFWTHLPVILNTFEVSGFTVTFKATLESSHTSGNPQLLVSE